MSDDGDRAPEAEATHPARAGTPGEMDQRGASDRRHGERRKEKLPVEAERRSGADRRTNVPRRKRSMNQYDMGEDVLEFVNEINRFKAKSGRAFPTWSEVLGILKDLGYEKNEA